MKTETFTDDTMTIAKKAVPIRVGNVLHLDLRFYAENPRIYSILNAEDEEPSQAVIQHRLEKMDHVKALVSSIRANGGLTDPLIVQDGKMVVLEGNSRLAAYRVLAKNDAAKWARVPCKILPENIEESLVFTLLGQYHIIGKKDWAPYEQAGYLYRRVKNHNVDEAEVAKELGLTVKTVNQLIRVYSFMREHHENRTDRWSYYDEYLGHNPTKRAREQYPELDKVVVDQVKEGRIERATDIRDKLTKVCAAGGKVLSAYVEKKKSLEDSYHSAMSRGAGDANYKRLKRFRDQVSEPALKTDILEMSAELRKKCAYELGKIAQLTAKLYKEIE